VSSYKLLLVGTLIPRHALGVDLQKEATTKKPTASCRGNVVSFVKVGRSVGI
jgi:hypothetical protein